MNAIVERQQLKNENIAEKSVCYYLSSRLVGLLRPNRRHPNRDKQSFQDMKQLLSPL